MKTVKRKDCIEKFYSLPKDEQEKYLRFDKLTERIDADNNDYNLFEDDNHEGSDSYKKIPAGSIDNNDGFPKIKTREVAHSYKEQDNVVRFGNRAGKKGKADTHANYYDNEELGEYLHLEYPDKIAHLLEYENDGDLRTLRSFDRNYIHGMVFKKDFSKKKKAKDGSMSKAIRNTQILVENNCVIYSEHGDKYKWKKNIQSENIRTCLKYTSI